MPELPEVERGRRIAEAAAAGRRIRRLRCSDDPIVYEGVTPEQVVRSLRGRRVLAVHRWGKQLWFELDTPPHPLFHFGMTGAFCVPDRPPLQLASGPRVDDARAWPPRFVKIHLWLDDGGELVMTDARRFGRIRLRQTPRLEPPLCELGFDPLLGLPSAARIAALLQPRTAAIKAVLLDQGFAAGVGNWIADEVLYQAGIDPRRPAASLGLDEVRALRARLASVVRRAVAVDAQKEKLPRTWLFHHRWGKDARARTARGEPIEFLTVAGRTTAWVPRRQR